MAQRAAGKAKGRAAKTDPRGARKSTTPGARDSAAASDIDPMERIRQLEAELAKVRAELAAAQGRNKVLQDNHDQVRNRIDWVIDSLHNLMEE